MDIIAMRHAHAVATDPEGDHARPLSERGRVGAAQAFQSLRAQRLEPELALVSPSARTRETAAIGMETFPAMQIVIVDELYNGPAERIAEAVDRVERVKTLLIVAHNPGISAYVGGAHILRPADAVVMADSERPIVLRAAED